METLRIQGFEVPRLGLGTWNMRGDTCQRAVLNALELGYRHIDTAEMYQNEVEVGAAVRESGLDRDQLFITTKIWNNHHRYRDAIKACQKSLGRLQMDYVDLLLIHWPSDAVPVEETLEAMNQLMEEGKTRHIGVSNFSQPLLENAGASSAKPIFCNQTEFNPYNHPYAVLEHCQQRDILCTAYSPLAKGRVQRDPKLKDFGARYGKSPAQVALRWLVQQENVAVIPKSANPKHQRENMQIFDFQLNEAEMESIHKS